MNSELFVVQPRWTTAARIVSQRLGKGYSGSYVQQVSAGTRTNSKVAAILLELGMMADQIKLVAA